VVEEVMTAQPEALPPENGPPAPVRPEPARPTPAAAPEPPAQAVRDRLAEQEHRTQLRQLLELAAAERPAARGQAQAAHAPRRRLEQQVRHRALDFYHDLAAQGGTCADAAQRLGILPRTLRHWDVSCRTETLCVAPPGRPLHSATVAEQRAVHAFLAEHGGDVGVPRLRQAFPELARAELGALVHAYRQELRRQRQFLRVLHWQIPGRVWAIDFAALTWCGQRHSLAPIAGRYPYLLAIRDLASGYQLAWLPVGEATAEQTMAVLAQLFGEHGAPLVLKCDNGAPFRAEATKAFLDAHNVLALYSPPACPAYNGSIEAAIGSLKTRTEDHARRHGHPGVWTCADVAAARQQGNTSHPPRLNGRTPAAVWQQRTPCRASERVCFELTVQRQRYGAYRELHLGPEALLDHWQQATGDRLAIERALVEHDYLLFTRRSIPLTIAAAEVTSNG
jgi:transposase InsO family protein